MRKNFYLQHPLMAMYDPRMKHLVEQEGLKGLGAYWVIIEKLSQLPEPRAQQDFLRPYCDRKKIKLSYLMKIICEYELFDIDEEGFFMPSELNPPRKKEKKVREMNEKVPTFDAKKHEKSKKTARKNAENSREKIAKNLKDSELENKSASHLKENIKDNIKTTATTKNKKTAAAVDNNVSHLYPAGKKEPPSTGRQTAVHPQPLPPRTAGKRAARLADHRLHLPQARFLAFVGTQPVLPKHAVRDG